MLDYEINRAAIIVAFLLAFKHTVQFLVEEIKNGNIYAFKSRDC